MATPTPAQAAATLAQQLLQLGAQQLRPQPPPPRKAPLSPQDEAAAALLAKQAKLGVLSQAVLTHDQAELAAQDREDVRRFKEKHVFGGSTAAAARPATAGQEMIVCDDFTQTFHAPPPPSRLPGLLLTAAGLLTGAGAVALLAGWLQRAVPAEPPAAPRSSPATCPASPPADVYDAVYEEQQPDGSWKVIRRERLK